MMNDKTDKKHPSQIEDKFDGARNRLKGLEWEMNQPDFWADKNNAQAIIKEIAELKAEIAGVGKYDGGDTVLTILAGAGGVDAEDFAQMLLNMYLKFFAEKNWAYQIIHQNENDHGGYRNITVEVTGPAVAKAMAGRQGPYGKMKNESGVHRLVRTSPFNAKGLRHTSFALVEFVPKFEQMNLSDIIISDDDLKVEYSRAGGPGGQNVNKRETAVRVVHLPTNISAHSDSQRSQAQNKEKALQILKGKLYTWREEEKKKKEQGLYVSKTMEIEWGNQIRSYVLHPYKMVKDHRTGVETAKVDDVLDGDIEKFLV